MSGTVRLATIDDCFQIRTLGLEDPAFRVSEKILFYEHEELLEWIAIPKDNILLVVAEGKEVFGFLFCKIMSYHWAMLDNSYVRPDQRGQGYGKQLYDALFEELRHRHIEYLTTLIEPSNTEAIARVASRFKYAKEYSWYEAWL